MTLFRVCVGALAIGVLAMTGCILGSDRCDAHQVEVKGNFALCVCEPNAVFNASGVGCTPCGDNEEVANGACVCKQGYAESGDAGCAASSIGTACDVSTPCPTDFPYCVTATGASDGYCSTQGCTTNADCSANYTCESDAMGRYCKKPPTGLGSACTSDADCATFDANSCETLSQHVCILKGCATGGTSCPNE